MTSKTETTIHQAFSNLNDPRQEEKVEHPLINIVFIAVCGILCGANNWTQISEFGKAQKNWFGEFLEMPKGFHRMIRLGRYLACCGAMIFPIVL